MDLSLTQGFAIMRRIAILGLILALTSGCQSARPRQRDAGPRPLFAYPGAPAPVAQGFVPGGAPAPVAPAPVAPGGPTPFPTVPQYPAAVPSNPPPPPAPNQFSPPPNGLPGAGGKIESNWQPTDARSPSPFEGRVLLSPPEPDDPKEAQKRAEAPPAEVGSKLPSTSLPVGIAQFAQVTPKVSAGLRPSDEGLDWLKTNNYRTVVHLRLPGENDAADRKEVELRGLTYVSLEVSPNLLIKETVDEFVRLGRDPNQQPVFVYDRDGALAGGLWYLWLRLVEESPEDVARIRARSLGLREDREGAHRDMWQSAQRYVAELKSR